MAKEFLSGFVPVCFVDFWFADQLNSLALVFLDIEFFFCFYIKEQTLAVANDLDLNSNDRNLTDFENDTTLRNETIKENDRFQCGTYDYGIRYFVAVLPAECRSFRNNIPQFCHSAKNHSAKKTFRNATIWQNNSAKNIRKFGNRKLFIWKPDNWQLIFGKS